MYHIINTDTEILGFRWTFGAVVVFFFGSLKVPFLVWHTAPSTTLTKMRFPAEHSAGNEPEEIFRQQQKLSRDANAGFVL